MKNPEIEGTAILLQERMPETFIVTKEEKELPERQKYQDYENYAEVVYNKVDEISNLIYHKRVNKLTKELSNIAQTYHNSFVNDIIKNIDNKRAKNIDCTWIIKTNDISTIDLIKEKYTEVEIY